MKQEADRHKSTSEYYRLNTKAVDELVNANVNNSPKVSQKEIDKYRHGKHFHIPGTLKCLFIKFWFPAAICFFFMWGLGSLDVLDTLVILSLAGGVVCDLLTNNALRFIAPSSGAYDKWMMYPRRRFVSLPLNILHSALVTVLVYNLYNLINTFAIRHLGAAEDAVTLGVEPILFGLFYLGFDLIIIMIKRIFASIVRDAEAKVKNAQQARR